MKKLVPRKDFALHLLNLRTKALRDKLPNLSERQIALMAKKWVKSKMRQLQGDLVEFTVPPLNRWEAWKEKHAPAWFLKLSPVRSKPI